ncbi:MAG: bi-domain-containing oxidoreductase [Trueperaceae bacterium]|nr:bi-domain-containing oxidoreductase [Trueperaceae bacterium]
MKQILQALDTGKTDIAEVPAPQLRAGHLLIRSQASVVSAGTERMLVDFGKANLINKARQQPERVKDVLNKIQTDGLAPTLQAVRSKLSQPLPLGYSNAGVVLAVGAGVEGFAVGDRVISNGHHAEVVMVPQNLCAKIPEGVSSEEAAFTVVSAIGLQGIRLAEPSLGEAFVVTGLGLIGLLTVQLLRAHGCRVLGIDFNPKRLELARSFGAETVDLSRGDDPLAAALQFSKGRGVDGVLVTASTKSSEPMHQAAQMCRKRGRIVLIGVTGLELMRSDFYEKELSFQVSCSYGPGRYDPNYEDKGKDYPIGFVRWTEQRNFEAVLDMMAAGQLKASPLITHQFEIEKATEAYDLISGGGDSLGIILNYPAEQTNEALLTSKVRVSPQAAATEARAAIIGAGAFTQKILLPAIQKSGAGLQSIVSSKGVSSVTAAKKFAIAEAATDVEAVLQDDKVNTVFITTQHDSHAELVIQALTAGKHVFVEKPLAITRESLAEVETCYERLATQGKAPILSIGFNRRFAPQVQKMKGLLESQTEPKSFIMTVNAGVIPADHWTQDPDIGGGRIVGEACHFIDLLRFLAGSSIRSVTAIALKSASSNVQDSVSFQLSFADGSIGTVHYLATGHKGFPKERLEVFCGGRILVLDNFRKLQGYGWSNFKGMRGAQDKGHEAGMKAFVDAILRGQASPIPFEEILEVSRASFDIVDALSVS